MTRVEDPGAPVLYGKYQLLEPLGRGTLAEVFKAKSHGVEGFEKILVIKRLLPQLAASARFVDTFIHEAKAAVALSHANIVQVFDLGRVEDTYFIAMEYVAGFDLARVLRLGERHDKPLPQELAVFVASEIAKGLDYAHRRRDASQKPMHIVHRDVSPQNVLLSFEGEVKLADFGIARARDVAEEETAVAALGAKFPYMAPERALGNEVDSRSDIFALGTVLYEVLSGVNPFAGDNVADTVQRVRDAAPKPLTEVAPNVSEDLASIVARAMARDPADRYANAGLLYEELLQFLYASGRRVGAHDLADYIADLRMASSAARATGTLAGLRASFGDETSSSLPGEPPTAPDVPLPSRSEPPPLLAPRSLSKPPLVDLGGATERRDVTVLAIARGNEGDPAEDMAARLVRRYGGQLIQRTEPRLGGTTLTLFGTKDPDGWDTDSAARCALRTARAYAASALERGEEPVVAFAVHAGRVLVDGEGAPFPSEHLDAFLAAAADLAQTAPAGNIYVSAATEKIIRSRFELEAVEASNARLFLLHAERGAVEALGKFVGRRDELRRIGEVLAVAGQRSLRVVSISGEAGVGKSRLLRETARRLRKGGHDVGVHIASCPSQSRDVPLAAIQEMLRMILGIDDVDGESMMRDKLARLRELGLHAADQSAIGVALGVSSDEPPRALPEALARVFGKLAEDRLTLFGWDRCEAMDEASRAVIDEALRHLEGTRIAVLFAHRAGLVHPWASLPGYVHLPLGAMHDDDISRLVALRLTANEVPLELLREVTLKTGGNPLYIEEYLKALKDAGALRVEGGTVIYNADVAAVEVPKTLRGIVASRIARIAPLERQLVQIAAVIGSRFSVDLIGTIAGGDGTEVALAVDNLLRSGVFLRQGTGEFVFAHDLVREVVQGGLTVEAQRAIHAGVAKAFEEIYPERLDELAERIAEHWREGGDREKSIDYLVRAADRLEAEHSLGSAIDVLSRAARFAMQLTTPDRERVLFLYRRIGDLAFRSRRLEEGARTMEDAVALAEGLGRDEHVARFSMVRGRLLVNASRFEEGRRWIERARSVAKRLGDGALLRDIALASAEADTRNGQIAGAVDSLNEALALSREAADVAAQIRCLTTLCVAHAMGGTREVALSALDEARALAGDKPDRFFECELAKHEALVHFFARDPQAAMDASARALELAREYGFTLEIAVNAHNLGEAYLRLGDFKRAFTWFRYSYETSREHGFTKVEMLNIRMLGYIDAVKLHSDEGRVRMVEAIEHAEKNGYVWDMLEGRYLLALVDAERGRTDEARRTLREVHRIASEHGNRRFVEDADEALAALDDGRTPAVAS